MTDHTQTPGALVVREITCIVCPVGCRLRITLPPPAADRSVDPSLVQVSGNKCERGVAYGIAEVTNPVRMVTATCAVRIGRHLRRLPVRTRAAVPKAAVAGLLRQIYALRVDGPVTAGQVIIGTPDQPAAGDIIAACSSATLRRIALEHDEEVGQ